MLNLFVAMLLDAFRVTTMESDDENKDDKIKAFFSEIKMKIKKIFEDIKMKWSKNLRIFESKFYAIK